MADNNKCTNVLESSNPVHVLGPAALLTSCVDPTFGLQLQRSGDLSPFNAPDATKGISNRRGLSTEQESQEQEQMESDAIEVRSLLQVQVLLARQSGTCGRQWRT